MQSDELILFISLQFPHHAGDNQCPSVSCGLDGHSEDALSCRQVSAVGRHDLSFSGFHISQALIVTINACVT